MRNGQKTGFWTEEFAAPYYALKDKGVEVTLASPKGGQPPVAHKSNEDSFQTEATVRFNKDIETKELLSKTKRLDQIKEEDFDAIFYPGGHGPLWDLAEDKYSMQLVEDFYKKEKLLSCGQSLCVTCRKCCLTNNSLFIFFRAFGIFILKLKHI